MKISIMEKLYKGNQYVFYINGFPLVSNDVSILNQAAEILPSFGFEITEENYVSEELNEVPNNEVKYSKLPLKGTVIQLGLDSVSVGIIKMLTLLGSNVKISSQEPFDFNISNFEEESRVFFITYENEHGKQWSGNKGFLTIEKAREQLKKEEYFETSRGFEKNAKGWAGKCRAYITPIVIEK